MNKIWLFLYVASTNLLFWNFIS